MGLGIYDMVGGEGWVWQPAPIVYSFLNGKRIVSEKGIVC